MMLLPSALLRCNGNLLAGGDGLGCRSFGIARDRIRTGAGLLGSGHHLIPDGDRIEAVLGDAKRHRSTFVIAAPDWERTRGANLLQQTGADELIDSLSGGFSIDIRRQFNSAIIAPRSCGQNDELRIGES
jgi:hypothetical protein